MFASAVVVFANTFIEYENHKTFDKTPFLIINSYIKSQIATYLLFYFFNVQIKVISVINLIDKSSYV